MGETDLRAPSVSAEPDRVGTRIVVRFGFAVAILSLAAMMLVGALFKLLERGARRRDAAAAQAAGLERRESRLPPQPRLEIHPARRQRDFRSAEERRLSTYGWMDRSTGTVHIPIERAMDAIAERGVAPLPAPRAAVPAPPPTPGPKATR